MHFIVQSPVFNNSLSGLAQSGSTCKGYGASVSNGDLGSATALIMAHESAHAYVNLYTIV